MGEHHTEWVNVAVFDQTKAAVLDGIREARTFVVFWLESVPGDDEAHFLRYRVALEPGADPNEVLGNCAAMLVESLEEASP